VVLTGDLLCKSLMSTRKAMTPAGVSKVFSDDWITSPWSRNGAKCLILTVTAKLISDVELRLNEVSRLSSTQQMYSWSDTVLGMLACHYLCWRNTLACCACCYGLGVDSPG